MQSLFTTLQKLQHCPVINDTINFLKKFVFKKQSNVNINSNNGQKTFVL